MSRYLIAVAVLILCLQLSAAAEKLSVDPNAGRSKVVLQTPSSDDVTQKVTYEARRKTVVSILADLSQMTGVKLYAGYNNLDWQVRDRRMNIFAKDLPLASLMNAIADVMKFKWSKNDSDGVVSYRLYMDRQTLLGADRQRYLEEEKLNKIEIELRAKAIDDLTAASTMTPDELESLKADNPVLYMQCKIGMQNLLPALFEEVPAAKQAWLSGQMMSLGPNDLSIEARQLIIDVLTKKAQIDEEIDGKDRVGSISANAVDKAGLYINYGKELTGYRGDKRLGDFFLFPTSKSGAYEFLSNPDNKSSRAKASAQIQAMDGTVVNTKSMDSVKEVPTDFGEPLFEHENDPVLDIKIKLKINKNLSEIGQLNAYTNGSDYVDTLAALAEATEYSVVSDGFWCYSKPNIPSGVEMPLKDILGKIESGRHNWQKKGSVIEFRDRDWFRKRAVQIPDAWLEDWRKTLIDTGTLDIDKLNQIASLDDEQIRENIMPDEILGNTWLPLQWIIFKSRDQISSLACLSDAQRALLYSTDGLDFDSVFPSQSTIISKMFASKTKLSDSSYIKLHGERRQRGKWFCYSITAASDEGQTVKWTFGTPVYSSPKKSAANGETPKDDQKQQSEGKESS